MDVDRLQRLSAQRVLGRRLKSQIRHAGVRQSDVGALLGYDETAMSAYLNGRRPWAEGIEDFEDRVTAAIEAARSETAGAA